MCGTDRSYERAAQPVRRAVENKKIWPPDFSEATRESLDTALTSGGVTKVASVPPTFAVLGDKIEVNGEVNALIVLASDQVYGFDTDGDEVTFSYNYIETINLLP